MSPETLNWISTYLNSAIELNSETITTVADFAFLWNIFEGTECESSISEQQIIEFSNRIASKLSQQKLVELLCYWIERYVDNNETTCLFDGLHFRNPTIEERVKAVLLGNEDSNHEKVFTLLMIVYRLRNNLFHGLKDITMLNDQNENLQHAVHVLRELMPLSGRAIYLNMMA